MKNINKIKLAAIFTIVLLMTSAFAFTTNFFVEAQLIQTPYENMQEGGSMPLPAGVVADEILDTRAFLSFRPNPVGVNQPILVNLWLNPPLHISRYFSDYKVTFTDPSGQAHVVEIDSYRADATAWFEFTPELVGDWIVKFEFPGGYFPPGNYTTYPGAFYGSGVTSFERSVYYEPSATPEQTLTVQEDIVYSWPDLGLPTDYWERPVSVEHREWWSIIGGYPGTGYIGGGPIWDELYPGTNPAWSATYDFHPWVIGPESSHVVWRKQGSLAGLLGATAGYFASTSGPSNPSIIYAGRCYGSYQDPNTDESQWECYDLRTGEVYWRKPASSTTISFGTFRFTSTLLPNIIEYEIREFAEVPGAEAASSWTANLMAISGGRLMKWDPYNGRLTANVSISPLSSATYYKNNWALSVQNLGGGNYRLINWTTAGTTSNFTSRIASNTTYAMSSLPSLIDWNAGYGATVTRTTPPSSTGVGTGVTISGYNLLTGEEIWDVSTDYVYYSGSCSVADHGKIAYLTQQGYFLAYDLATGNLAWQSEQMDYPWSRSSFGAYAIQSAYGMFFREGYDGVYAFNWDDGSIEWRYEAPSLAVYESPYINENGGGVYPFNTGATIADGKLFTYNTEHTTSYPITRGWGLHCIDVFTGEEVWKIANPMSPGGIADGYLVASNSWDGYSYVFGKGKSETSVTAEPKAIAKGTQVMIEGTVLDMSPAQPETPCVSKESMSLQMEYLHMQRPIGGIWENETITGVPVTLTAIGSDGSYIDLGTVTTEGYYGTYGLSWTPTEEGTYQIIASFEGDDSYGSSGASTYFTVGPAAAAGPQGEPGPTGATGATGPQGETGPAAPVGAISAEIGMILAIIIAVIISIAGSWFILKRK